MRHSRLSLVDLKQQKQTIKKKDIASNLNPAFISLLQELETIEKEVFIENESITLSPNLSPTSPFYHKPNRINNNNNNNKSNNLLSSKEIDNHNNSYNDDHDENNDNNSNSLLTELHDSRFLISFMGEEMKNMQSKINELDIKLKTQDNIKSCSESKINIESAERNNLNKKVENEEIIKNLNEEKDSLLIVEKKKLYIVEEKEEMKSNRNNHIFENMEAEVREKDKEINNLLDRVHILENASKSAHTQLQTIVEDHHTQMLAKEKETLINNEIFESKILKLEKEKIKIEKERDSTIAHLEREKERLKDEIEKERDSSRRKSEREREDRNNILIENEKIVLKMKQIEREKEAAEKQIENERKDREIDNEKVKSMNLNYQESNEKAINVITMQKNKINELQIEKKEREDKIKREFEVYKENENEITNERDRLREENVLLREKLDNIFRNVEQDREKERVLTNQQISVLLMEKLDIQNELEKLSISNKGLYEEKVKMETYILNKEKEMEKERQEREKDIEIRESAVEALLDRVEMMDRIMEEMKAKEEKARVEDRARNYSLITKGEERRDEEDGRLSTTNSNLPSKVSSLRYQLQERRKDIELLQHNNKLLVDEISCLNQFKVACSSQKQQLQETIYKLQKKVDALSSNNKNRLLDRRVEELEREAARLSKCLDEKDFLIKTLRNEVQSNEIDMEIAARELEFQVKKANQYEDVLNKMLNDISNDEHDINNNISNANNNISNKNNNEEEMKDEGKKSISAVRSNSLNKKKLSSSLNSSLSSASSLYHSPPKGYGKNFSFPNENVDDNKEDFEEAEIIENGETADGEVVMLLTVEVKEGEEQVLTLYKNQSPKMAAKEFCKKYNLSESTVLPLSKFISNKIEGNIQNI